MPPDDGTSGDTDGDDTDGDNDSGGDAREPTPPDEQTADEQTANEQTADERARDERAAGEIREEVGGEEGEGRTAMSVEEFAVLLAIWLACTLIMIALMCRSFAATGFSFHLCFSLAYLLTFYSGFPLSAVLVFRFRSPIVESPYLAGALLLALAFYLAYHDAYTAGGSSRGIPGPAFGQGFDEGEAVATAAVLALIALAALTAFVARNGLLLFKLRTYSQTFSRQVSGFALRRFFSFFLPGMLIAYFLRPGVGSWLMFLAACAGFGAFTYVAVGGTRANLAMALALFVAVGLAEGHLHPRHLPPLAALGVTGMALLALARYRLPGPAVQQVHHAVLFTRDTLSPWENLALTLRHLPRIERQGLAPIVRDFYVHIPRRLWPGRPDLVLNTPNYFTRNVLGRGPGVTISPTLISSCLIMGGLLALPVGALACGRLIRWYDRLYDTARRADDPGTRAVVKAFCFGSLFNIAVLVREGPDSFVSRFAFHGAGFGLSALAAKGSSRLSRKVGNIRGRTAAP
ncbi:WzyE family oligosaccharide polymerase [Streptosporangium sp. NPDC002524]|uniref:WzyE family oligosaccharide polymerase n=1 Tax=Streptosporangium sp. NPDC002524 TaxID=3154537 RepID=UPI00331A8168